jgi:hypothetical protein
MVDISSRSQVMRAVLTYSRVRFDEHHKKENTGRTHHVLTNVATVLRFWCLAAADRVFGILRERNPELTGERRRTVLKPPQVSRTSSSLTGWPSAQRAVLIRCSACCYTAAAAPVHLQLIGQYPMYCRLGHSRKASGCYRTQRLLPNNELQRLLAV